MAGRCSSLERATFLQLHGLPSAVLFRAALVTDADLDSGVPSYADWARAACVRMQRTQLRSGKRRKELLGHGEDSQGW